MKRRHPGSKSVLSETAASLRAPVGVLPLDHDILLRFHQLGIYTIRDFTRFSSGSLRRRFGREVEQLQLFARGVESLPVQPAAERPRLRREMRLLYPEGSATTLLHHLHMLTEELISQAWSRQELIVEIVISLCPEEWPGSMEECIEETLRSARPSGEQELWDRLQRDCLDAGTGKLKWKKLSDGTQGNISFQEVDNFFKK